MEKVQTGGVVKGQRKVWTVSYADDVVLMASNEEGIKKMVIKFGRYIKELEMEMNTEKSKIMRGRKGEGSSKK